MERLFNKKGKNRNASNSVWLAYKHNQGPEIPMGTPNHTPMIAVTACVDKISARSVCVLILCS